MRGLQQITDGCVDAAVTFLKLYRMRSYTVSNYNDFVAYCSFLNDYIKRYDSKSGGILKMQTKILLVVATQIELQITIEKLEKLGPVIPVVGDLSHFKMTINSVLIYIVKCQM